jgi:hypothetical protein
LETDKKPPEPLCTLLQFDGDARSKRFLRQIRSYNSLFAFTSLGAAVDRTINSGNAPYVFKINGVVHHRIGTLLPHQGTRPRFAQLYIMILKMRYKTDLIYLRVMTTLVFSQIVILPFL